MFQCLPITRHEMYEFLMCLSTTFEAVDPPQTYGVIEGRKIDFLKSFLA